MGTITWDAVSLVKPVKTEVTEHIFVYPTHTIVWTVFYGPRSYVSPTDLPEYASPTDERMGITLVTADIYFTEEYALTRLLDYTMTPYDIFTIRRVWHRREVS